MERILNTHGKPTKHMQNTHGMHTDMHTKQTSKDKERAHRKHGTARELKGKITKTKTETAHVHTLKI